MNKFFNWNLFIVIFISFEFSAAGLAAGLILKKVEVFPIEVRVGEQFAQPGQYAVATIINSGSAIAENELFLVISGQGESRQQQLPALQEDQTLLMNLSLPSTEKLMQVTVSLRDKTTVLDSKTVETQKPEPFTFYIMPSSHLCFGWITGELTDHWGAAQVIKIALDYLDKYPNYAFNIEAVWFLKDYLDKYPEDHTKITKYMKEHRLYASGWTTPMQTTIFPEDETYVRQLTMAQWWLKREFGLVAPVVMDFDAAANRVQTAQIFSKAGIDTYFRGRYGRGFKYGKTPEEPGNPYEYFTSPDGSSLLTYSSAANLHAGYCTTPMGTYVEQFAKARSLNVEVATAISTLMRSTEKATHVRIHGGALSGDQAAPANPSRAVTAWNTAVEIPEIKIATMPIFFEACKQSGLKGVDTRPSGQDIFWARLEGVTWVSARHMWQAATYLQAAEKAATLDTMLNGTIYPRTLLNELWDHITLLSHHEHDWNNPLENYQYDQSLLEASSTTAEIITQRSLERLSHRIALTDPQGVPIVVWNLLSWDRVDYTEAILSEEVPSDNTTLFDADNKPISCEIIQDGSIRKIRFIASVPAMGYTLYYLKPGDQTRSPVTLKSGQNFIENEFYRIEVDLHTGCIKSIFDKDLSRELLTSPGNELRALEDVGHDPKLGEAAWAAENLTGKSQNMRDNDSKVLISQSSFDASITVRGDFFGVDDKCFGAFREQVVTLSAGSKRVDFITKIDWSDRLNYQLRLEMPFAIQNPQITYDTQYGVLDYDSDDPGLGAVEPTRESYRNSREVSRWICLYDRSDKASVCMTVPALINYFDGGIVSSLLLRRAGMESSAELPQAGLHTFRYSLTSGRGDWKDVKAYRFGREQFQDLNPLRTVFPTRLVSGYSLNEQSLTSSCGSLVSIGGENVVLAVLKMAEEGYSVVARLYEAEGKSSSFNLNFNLPKQGPARVHVQFPQKVDFAQEVNLLEEPVAEIDVKALENGIAMKPWEIKTLHLGFSWGAKVLMQCPFCNKDIHWDMTKCSHCGKELPERK